MLKSQEPVTCNIVNDAPHEWSLVITPLVDKERAVVMCRVKFEPMPTEGMADISYMPEGNERILMEALLETTQLHTRELAEIEALEEMLK